MMLLRNLLEASAQDILDNFDGHDTPPEHFKKVAHALPDLSEKQVVELYTKIRDVLHDIKINNKRRDGKITFAFNATYDANYEYHGKSKELVNIVGEYLISTFKLAGVSGVGFGLLGLCWLRSRKAHKLAQVAQRHLDNEV